MEIVFIGLALSARCFGIWRYGKTMGRGGCCGSGAVSPVKRRAAALKVSEAITKDLRCQIGLPRLAVLSGVSPAPVDFNKQLPIEELLFGSAARAAEASVPCDK